MVNYYYTVIPIYLVSVGTFLCHVIEHLLCLYTKTSSDQVPGQNILKFACVNASEPDIYCRFILKENEANRLAMSVENYTIIISNPIKKAC